jgi:hypothetical protein
LSQHPRLPRPSDLPAPDHPGRPSSAPLPRASTPGAQKKPRRRVIAAGLPAPPPPLPCPLHNSLRSSSSSSSPAATPLPLSFPHKQPPCPSARRPPPPRASVGCLRPPAPAVAGRAPRIWAGGRAGVVLGLRRRCHCACTCRAYAV